MFVAENHVGCGHRNLRPTSHIKRNAFLPFMIENSIQVIKVKASCSKRGFRYFVCIEEFQKRVWPGGEGGQVE